MPAPDEYEDLDAPTRPRLARLAAGTGPVAAIVDASEPGTPRWALVSIGVLGTAAAALATALVLAG